MGWTPSSGKQPGVAREAAPSPTRAARRRARLAAAKGPSTTPLVDAHAVENPRQSTGARPRGGVNTADYEARGEDDRTRMKVKLGKRWSEIMFAIKAGEYTWAEFCEGPSEEELARGQLRDSAGGFTGRPPSLVPREFHLACTREQKRRFEEIFGSEVLGLAREYVKLAKDNQIPAKDRAKLLQYAMERIFGGIPKDVRVSQEAPWEQMVVNVISDGDDGMSEHLRRRYEGYAERKGEGVADE